MRIAGIDYSLRCPAICLFEGNKRFTISECSFHFKSSVKKYDEMKESLASNKIHPSYLEGAESDCARYNELSQWALNLVADCDLVCIEDYAFAAKGKVFHIGENVGLLKYFLWSHSPKINYVMIPPTKIKKFGSGRGNAKKEEVYSSFCKETGMDLQQLLEVKSKQIKSPISDIADAYYICKYGHYLAFKS